MEQRGGQETTVELIDDLNGQPAAETVQFGIGTGRHRTLEIDLSAANAARLRKTLAEYIAHARRISGRPARRPATPTGRDERDSTEVARRGVKRRGHPLAYSREVREWALARGERVSARGRISNAVIEKYERRHRRRTRKER